MADRKSRGPARYTFDARRLLEQFPDPDLTANEIADTIGVTRTCIQRWKAGNACKLTPWQAGRSAVRLGVEPRRRWGEDWCEAALAPTRVRAA